MYTTILLSRTYAYVAEYPPSSVSRVVEPRVTCFI